MKFLDLTFASPFQNLACDEALLLVSEERHLDSLLRVWMPQTYFVVLGLSNRIRTEADLDACRAAQVPVLRRASGGGAVLNGPGCLNYSLILRMDLDPALQQINETNRWILQRHRTALEPLLGRSLSVEGTSDLVLHQLKFSGNAQRRRKNYLLFHGTFLLNFDIPLIARLLPMPSQQPEYRKLRSHQDFLINLNLSPAEVTTALRRVWQAHEILTEVPYDRIHELADGKYMSKEWIEKF